MSAYVVDTSVVIQYAIAQTHTAESSAHFMLK